MNALQQRRYNAMKYLAQTNPKKYELRIDEGRPTLFECWETSIGNHSRAIATVDEDIRYIIENV